MSVVKIGCALVLVVWVAATIAIEISRNEPGSSAKDPGPFDDIKLEYSIESGPGPSLLVDLTIRNRSTRNLKDFVVSCETHGKSGTTIDRLSTTIYEAIASHDGRRFRHVSFGLVDSQTATVYCAIAGATPGQ